MDRFEYLVGLISLIVGLGLADVAVSLHRLFKQRDKVRWDSLTLTAAAFATLNLVWIWYEIWTLRQLPILPEFWFYLSLLLEMFLLFLGAAACLPDEGELAEAYDWSLAAYYDKQRRYIWTTFALFHISYACRWAYFVFVAFPRPLAPELFLNLGFILMPVAICAGLALARPKVAQWGLLVLLVAVKVFEAWGATL